MSIADSDSKSKRKWFSCGCLLVMFLVVIVVPALGFIGWGLHSSRQVSAEMAQIRAAGEPTSPDELYSFYGSLPESEDATRLWVDAASALSTEEFSASVAELPIIGSSQVPIPPPGQPWDEKEAVRAALDQCDEWLEKAHRAAEMGGGARYALKFEDGFNMQLTHVQQLRSVARMLSLQAHFRAHDGDAHGAAESIHAIFAASRSLENEPVILSQLVGVAINGVAVNQIKELMPHIKFSEEDLRMFQEDIRSMRPKENLKRAFIGERTIGSEVFRNPGGAAPAGGAAHPLRGLVRASNEDLAYYLKIFRELITACDLEFPDTIKTTETVFADFKKTLTSSPIAKLRYIMTGLVTPAMQTAIVAAARAHATNQAADAATAIELFKRREGKLPGSLQELVPDFLPEAPVDPFDGEPMRYAVEPGGYVVYSIGMNGTDESGTDDPINGDVVFRVLKMSGDEAVDSSDAETR